MRLLATWLLAGAVAGLVSGALFGGPYMLAGAGIGIVAGLGIALGLRGAGIGGVPGRGHRGPEGEGGDKALPRPGARRHEERTRS